MTTQVVQAGSRVTVKAEAGTDGRDASREAFDAGLIANPTISAYTAYVAAMVATGGGANAATLNGQPGSYYLNASNLASGTVPAERLPAVSFASLTGKPTTIAGYGITDAVTTFAQLGGKPTTLAGYGITNAQPLDADLTALAALTGTNTVYYRSAADTWSPVSFGSGLTFSGGTLSAVTGGGGTVTSVAIATANGVSGNVTNPNTTPSISITLGAITPTSVAASGVITGSNISGTNTGDQTITLTGDVTGSGTGSFAATIANVPLKAIGAVTPAADRVPYYTSGTAAAVTTLTSYGRTLIALADRAALTAQSNTFTTTLSGDVPAPVSATGRYLKDDGTWSAVIALREQDYYLYDGTTTIRGFWGAGTAAQTVDILLGQNSADAAQYQVYNSSGSSTASGAVPASNVSIPSSGYLFLIKAGDTFGAPVYCKVRQKA